MEQEERLLKLYFEWYYASNHIDMRFGFDRWLHETKEGKKALQEAREKIIKSLNVVAA